MDGKLDSRNLRFDDAKVTAVETFFWVLWRLWKLSNLWKLENHSFYQKSKINFKRIQDTTYGSHAYIIIKLDQLKIRYYTIWKP